jgi:hypothetical protein
MKAMIVPGLVALIALGAVSDVVEKLCGVVSDLFNES